MSEVYWGTYAGPSGPCGGSGSLDRARWVCPFWPAAFGCASPAGSNKHALNVGKISSLKSDITFQIFAGSSAENVTLCFSWRHQLLKRCAENLFFNITWHDLMSCCNNWQMKQWQKNLSDAASFQKQISTYTGLCKWKHKSGWIGQMGVLPSGSKQGFLSSRWGEQTPCGESRTRPGCCCLLRPNPSYDQRHWRRRERRQDRRNEGDSGTVRWK